MSETEFTGIINFMVQTSGITEQQQAMLQLGEEADRMALRQREMMEQLNRIQMSVRGINAARLAVQQTSRAIRQLNPSAALYAFLNIVQVLRNLQSWLKMVQAEQTKTLFQQTMINLMSGPAGWAVIAGALVGAGVVMAAIEGSFQRGGTVGREGLYYLHRGEHVIPASYTNHFGPFTMVVQNVPTNPEAAMRNWGIEAGQELRRGGYA